MARTVSTSAGAPRDYRTIGIIDDDESVRRALGQLLGAIGFRTRSYASAEEFLGHARSDRIDCLLLDIHLDGMSGFDLQRYLVVSGSDLPIVFMTGRDDPGLSQMARLAGCVGYLAKPFSRESLLAEIDSVAPAAPRDLQKSR